MKGESETPHIQEYVQFKTQKYLKTLKKCNVNIAEYRKKDGDVEVGEITLDSVERRLQLKPTPLHCYAVHS